MAGRVRSGLPLFRRLLASSESLSSNGSTVGRTALLYPTFSRTETRNFSTSSAPSKEQKVKVPLRLYGVFGNYASALYIAATKANVLDKVESELVDLVEASKKSPKFYQFLKDLTVPTQTRVKAVNEVSDAAKFSDITKNFLVVLAENGRLRNVESIVLKFIQLCMAHKGEVKVIVTTVIPLPPEEEKELQETLREIIGQDKKIKVEEKIDPSILGGLVIEFEQKVFDMSIKTRAKHMERLLREPIDFGSV